MLSTDMLMDRLVGNRNEVTKDRIDICPFKFCSEWFVYMNDRILQVIENRSCGYNMEILLPYLTASKLTVHLL